MKVLSLFDGISCLRVALGDQPVEYLASEIDKNAIKVAKKNFPTTKHLGSVCDISGLNGIDLLCGGSPCTDLSIAKKGREGLKGERSKLFYEYVRIWKESKPTWFILENVASMPKADKDTITSILGVEPILINAALVSAQNRKRLFWTNIPVKGLPVDRHIMLKDILQPGAEVDDRMVMKGKSFSFTANYSKVIEDSVALGTGGIGLVKVGHIGDSDAQANRVYSTEGKSSTLSANGGGLGAKTGLYIGRIVGRRTDKDGKRIDNTIDVAYKQRLEVSNADKSNTLSTVLKDNIVVQYPKHIRKLTPIECERLQSLPDNYTEGISMTGRYKALGNAFNVEVIKFILTFLPVSKKNEASPDHP